MKKYLFAASCFASLIGCGYNLNNGGPQRGIEDVSKDVASITFVCGQSAEVSDERRVEFEAGLAEILKKPISGDAMFGLIQKRVSGWKLTQPNYEKYLSCVSEQSKLAIQKMELDLKESEAKSKHHEEEKWISDVALIRMNENLYRWQRFVHHERWQQFDTTEVEQIIDGLKKKPVLA